MIDKQKQTGAALITSLLIVLVVSILGVAASQQITSLRKVTAVNYDNTLSFNNAESALAEAYGVLDENKYAPDDLAIYTSGTINTTNNWRHDNNNWSSGKQVSGLTEGAPTYLIEDAGTSAGFSGGIMLDTNEFVRHFYRATAKAQGKGEAVTYLQSYYATVE